jgi:hypothetical protein
MLLIIDLETTIQVAHLYVHLIQMRKADILGIALIMLIYGDEQQTPILLGDDLVLNDGIYLVQQIVRHL